MKRSSLILGSILSILIFVTALALPLLGLWESVKPWSSPTKDAIERKLKREHETKVRFDLVDANQAPGPILDLVREGFNIMIHTPQQVPNNVSNEMSCTHCHFSGGDTLGGKNGGISLAGVAAVYPKYDERFGRVIDLQTRINNCFKRSMNGKPLPLDSHEMLALVTYFQWLSNGLPIYRPVSWLGLTPITSVHEPNPEKGQEVYAVHCALCHGKEGQGEIDNRIPPLWGANSFNNEAGMNKIPTLASFIYWNMPYQDPSVSEEEALDVAAFIVQQDRPRFRK